MRIKQYILGGACFLAMAGCAVSPGQWAAKPADDGMALIPAGEFTMGSNKEENQGMWREANALNPFGYNDRLYVNERPAHRVELPAFKIDKYEVSNTQYQAFVTATQHRAPAAWKQNGFGISDETLRSYILDELRHIATNDFKLDMDVTAMSQEALLAELEKANALYGSYPATGVTWSDANDYCYWAGKRLPSEAEWEKAARGPMGFEFPWGNSWDPKKVNTTSDNPDIPYSPVGSYPDDKSGYGVYDMGANVSEWVSDWYNAYPGGDPSVDNQYGRNQRVVRGGMASSGHYDSISLVFRTARRMHLRPNSALIDLGFRCAKDVETKGSK